MDHNEEKHIVDAFRDLLQNENFFNKQLDEKINNAVSDASVDRKQHFLINIATILISLAGVFMSYAVFWKESIETTEQIKKNIEIIQTRDLPALDESMNQLNGKARDNTTQLTILSGDLQFSLRTLREVKNDLEEIKEEFEDHENDNRKHSDSP